MPTYFPGEEIIGQLVINLTSEKKMVRIDVWFEGRGSVNWTEEWKKVDDCTTESFSANETYFNCEMSVYNGPKLPLGIHNLPFSFTLPQNIPESFGPESFEGEGGHVWYKIAQQTVRSS